MYNIQLRQMVESGVPQEELQQILAQLRANPSQVPAPQMNHHTFSSPLATSGAFPMQSHQHQHMQVPNHMLMSNLQAGLTPAPVQPIVSSSSNQSGRYDSLAEISSQQPNNVTSSVPSISGISNLLESLVKAGLVSSSSSTPVGAGSSSQAVQSNAEGEEPKHDVNKKHEEEVLESQKDYARSIFGMQVKLTTTDISR